MKKSLRLLLPLLIVLSLALGACSTTAAPTESVSPSPAPAPSPSATFAEPEAASPGQTPTRFVSGILDAVTDGTLTLTCSDGSSRRFGRGPGSLVANADTLEAGSFVLVEYDDESGPLAAVVRVTVIATPDQMLAMRAKKLLVTMTLEEKIGQMFLAHYPASDAPGKTLDFQPGGYILFSADFKAASPDSVRAAVGSCQDNAKIPLLIGVDEEGGTVNRVSRYQQFRDAPFSSPQKLYASDGWDAIVADTLEKAALLESLGINLNLAPVCDVSVDPSDFIYPRAFGQDAAQTVEYVRTVVEAMASGQLGCVLKHFPGYGSNADTHTGSAYDERPIQTFRTSDFLPFEAGIDAGAGAVMVCHNVVECMDATAPASLSADVQGILRDELGFDGVVITDDLNMQAVLDYAGDVSAAVLAVLAGNDMLCTPYFEEQIPAVLDAVRDGTISEQRIDESVLRILIWKLRLGLID